MTAPPAERIEIPLPGTDRVIDVVVAGPADGDALVFHSGTPSGPALLTPLAEAAAAAGFRYVNAVRPGYGRSTPNRGRRVADVVPDTLAVLDTLGYDQFVTVGWSGGGPHALACAALAPDRCRAVVSVAGVAPRDGGGAGFDWHAGMGAENLEEFGLAAGEPGPFEEWLAGAAEVMPLVEREVLADALGDLVTAPDVRAIDGALGDYLHASIVTAFEVGVAGWRDDDIAFLSPWGFGVESISVPALVAQGSEDRMVPPAHGRWLGAGVGGAEVGFLEGEGHISIWDAYLGDVIAFLERHR